MKIVWAGLFIVLTGCSFRIDWPRHEVFVHIEEPGFNTLSGLTHLRVTVDSVRLIPCDDDMPQGYASVWDLFIPSAHAHGLGSPTELKVPGVLGFGGDSNQFTLGVLEPPPNSYCEVQVGFAPADDDALGSDAHEMDGLSLSTAFMDRRLTSILKADVRRPLSPPLTLPDSHDIRVNLTLSIDGAFADTVKSPDTPNWETPLWNSILESVRVHVEDVP